MNKEDHELYGITQNKPFPDHAGDINLLVLLPHLKLVLSYSQEDNCLKVTRIVYWEIIRLVLELFL